jgi:hypothetical protein
MRVSLTWLLLILNMIVYYEFRMLRDIITEIGEKRDMIGNEAVKDFFEDLRSHFYDYVRLRESFSRIVANLCYETKCKKTFISYIMNHNYGF